MDLIPHEELKPAQSFNLAPMIDFLFLMLSLFATLAISRAALSDAEIKLVEINRNAHGKQSSSKQELRQINLSIAANGTYKWITEFQEYPMGSLEEVQEEIARQYKIGALSQDKGKTEFLLHIDRQAPWERVAHMIFAIRELGFSTHPVYEQSVLSLQ